MNKLILFFSTIFFAWFCIDAIPGAYHVKLMGNDFSKPDILDWFNYELKTAFYILFFGLVGVFKKGKFQERVLIAICMDAVLTIIRVLVFGYFEPDYLSVLINAIPYSYIVYSYFSYGSVD